MDSATNGEGGEMVQALCEQGENQCNHGNALHKLREEEPLVTTGVIIGSMDTTMMVLEMKMHNNWTFI
jgi:hypothetical protein